MGSVSDLLKNEIYPKLSAEIIFSDLDGIKTTSYGILATCPSCNKKQKFCAHNESPYASCFRASCGYKVTWWSYTQERYGLASNRDVLEKLAELANYPLESINASSSQKQGQGRSFKGYANLYQEIYQMGRNALLGVNESDEPCMQAVVADNYLLAQRKWPAEWIKKNRAVIAFPGDRESLMARLEGEGYHKGVLFKSGLFREAWGDKYNLLITYFNELGKPSAFIGVLFPKGEDDDLAKYMGSKNISKQGSYKDIPFGLAAAKGNAKQHGEIYIVEGFFDQMMFYSCGLQRTVATTTNRLTGVQAEFLLDDLPNVGRYIFALDNDEAGKLGTIESVQNVLSKKGGDLISFFVLVPPVIDGVAYKDFDDARQKAGYNIDAEKLEPIPFYKWLVDFPLYGNDTEYNRDKNLDVYAGIIDQMPDEITEPLKAYLVAKGVDMRKVEARTKAGKAFMSSLNDGQGKKKQPAKTVRASQPESSGDERVRDIPGYRRLMSEENARSLLKRYVTEAINAARKNDIQRLRAISNAILKRKDLDKRGAARRLTRLAGKVSQASRRWQFREIGEDLKAEALRIIAEEERAEK